MSFQVCKALVVERLGDEWLVLDQAIGVVHALAGPAAEAITAITTNGDLGSVDRATIEGLLASGIIEVAGSTEVFSAVVADSAWNRRRFLIGTTTAAAVGLTTLVLPDAAAAASVPATTTPTTATTVPAGVQSNPSNPVVTYTPILDSLNYTIEVRWPWPELPTDSVARWSAKVAFTDDPNPFANPTNRKHNANQLGTGQPQIRVNTNASTANRTYRATLFLTGDLTGSPSVTLDIPATPP